MQQFGLQIRLALSQKARQTLAMEYDEDKIDEVVLALLFLTLHDGAPRLEGSRLGRPGPAA
jgi:hypothetical protein